jgi:hypothetical protein
MTATMTPFMTPSTRASERLRCCCCCCRENGGQRIVTFLMYLSTPEEGGETVFPYADLKVKFAIETLSHTPSAA